MKNILLFCKSYLLLYKLHLFIFIVISIIVSLSGLVSPFIIGDFIDQLMTAESMNFIFRYFTLFAGINLTTLILGYISGQLYVRLQMRLGYSLNRNIIKQLQQAPLDITNKYDTSYLNQRINNDANALIIFCIGITQNIIINIVLAVVTFMLMFIFHQTLALILLIIACAYFIFYTLYKKVLYRVSHAFKESQAKFFAKLNEQLFNIRFIKLHSLFYSFLNRLDVNFNNLLQSALKYQRSNYVFSGMDKLVIIAAQLILLLFGGIEIMEGNLTIGRFIIISSYFNMMLGAIRYFFSLGQSVQDNRVAFNRIQEFITVENELNGSTELAEINTIEMNSVCFAYGERMILRDKNISLTKGNIYVLQGPNGVGKSTLVDVLIGLQNGNFDGRVIYNGCDITQVNMYSLRKNHIGISEQEPTLLSDTLMQNLILDNHIEFDSKIENIESIAKILGFDSYVNSLQKRYETVINEGSVNISGGEKQKVSILRALLKNPDVLIFDEPTSALDIKSKTALRYHLNKIKENKIIIIITHDEDFIDRNCDIILSLI